MGAYLQVASVSIGANAMGKKIENAYMVFMIAFVIFVCAGTFLRACINILIGG